MRTRIILLIFVVLVIAIGAAVYVVPREQKQNVDAFAISGQATLPMQQITIITKGGAVSVAAEVASTREEQMDGLSNRAGLADNVGMLFVFNPPTMDGFWMKDMRFPLDIIWAGSDGTITTLYKNISPDTYPTSFYPSVPATYVLEVPAGFADEHQVAIGSKIVVQ